MDAFSEFQLLVAELRNRKIDYALCGGIAMAVHGYPRATIDIDLLVPPHSLTELKMAATNLGYGFENRLSGFSGGQVEITRMTKIEAESGDYLMLDLLHVTPLLDDVWSARVQMESSFGNIWVVTKPGLIKMKKLRNSKQDEADIENLMGAHDKN